MHSIFQLVVDTLWNIEPVHQRWQQSIYRPVAACFLNIKTNITGEPTVKFWGDNTYDYLIICVGGPDEHIVESADDRPLEDVNSDGELFLFAIHLIC